LLSKGRASDGTRTAPGGAASGTAGGFGALLGARLRSGLIDRRDRRHVALRLALRVADQLFL
jgi:hypothetical protein